MRVLTLEQARRAAENYPSGLDCYSKLYPLQISVLSSNNKVPAEGFIKFEKNQYFYADCVTASYTGTGITRADNPFIRLTDIANGIELSNVALKNASSDVDGFLSLEANFTPGILTEPITNNDLVKLEKINHIFLPQSQLRVEVLNPNNTNNLTVDICVRGYVIQNAKD